MPLLYLSVVFWIVAKHQHTEQTGNTRAHLYLALPRWRLNKASRDWLLKKALEVA